MNKILKAGLLGCGSVALRGVLPHLSEPDAKQKVSLVAVADVALDRARATAEKFGVPHAFDSLEAMLAGVELDMVLITTPIPLHFANAMTAIAAGKHVYVQKSMTVSTREADLLLAARDRAGVKLVAAPGFELFPLTAQLRQAVQDGLIGKVAAGYTYAFGFGHEHEGIRSGEGALATINPLWYYRAGAGPLPDVTIYSLQLLTSVLGPVRRLTALANKLIPEREWRGEKVAIEVPDNHVVLLEFASGAIVTAIGADASGSQRFDWGAFELFGTHGTLTVTRVDGATGYPLAFEVQGGGGWGTFGQDVGHRVYEQGICAQPYLRGAHLVHEEGHLYADIMELADAVLEDRAPRASGEQARHVVEIIEKAHRAVETGQTQDVQSRF
jgi:predicted dehydrogenase